MEIERRDALAMLAGLAVSACSGGGSAASPTGIGTPSATAPAAAPTPTPTPAATTAPVSGMNALATPKGLRIGSCYAWSPPGADAGSFANPAYAELLLRDCGLLVPENELKWQALRPSPTAFDFARLDAMLAWARDKGFAVRGHNLLWHQSKWLPHWLNTYDFGAYPAQEAERLLVEHIITVSHRYGTQIGSYDVVNEAVDPADGTLYQTLLSRALGGAEATLDLAFHTAKQAAPNAQLVYNDYMSWEPGNAQHRAGVLKLLEGFRRRGVPVDALGIQSHIITQDTDVAASVAALEGDWRRFLDSVTAMGYDLLITELDVRDNNLPINIAVRDGAVADYAKAYLDIMFAQPRLRDVLFWGMSDRYSWIEGFEPRPDRARRRPCPYDEFFVAKPLRAAVAAAIAAAPVRA